MTVSPIALRRKTERKPHQTAQYWRKCQIEELFALPFLDLVYKAAEIHRQHFNPQEIQLSTLLSIKTGGCPEDCEYCPQSAHYNTGLEKSRMMDVEEIVEKAKIAKARGASRFCMGAAWRGPKPKDVATVSEIIKEVKGLGLETCGTFGMLEDGMAEDLKQAGLDYYNHNLDTDPDRYNDIIHTRRHEDRMDTLGKVRGAGLKVCCGGIVGMNETRPQRAGLIASLANLDPQPESVPINQLVKVEGTPLADAEDLDWTEFVRTIAVARIAMPRSYVRLSAGRSNMPEAMQAMCFLAGANSIFYGDKLLTTENPEEDGDRLLMHKLDLYPLRFETENEYQAAQTQAETAQQRIRVDG
ncbi:MAG: biotin synthase BioB [Neisseria sp.]|uniref:biotin synthase BioB n=1 Tax=Neisseria sp. TaxID=192066 RepID=UPI0026DC4834|nr:biotin synthase BioB [Neisseria sp.]MDO4640521.1 biotin synthase BioB [Neisseria sp.]